MKQTFVLDQWRLRQAPKTELCENAVTDEILRLANEESGWVECGCGDEVQSVFLKAGLIDEEVLVGKTEKCVWIAREDWIYVCDFSADLENISKQIISFKGLDTVADIYLNDTQIGHHEDMFLQDRIDVTGKLKEHNRLLIYFYSPFKLAEKYNAELPEDWQGMFQEFALLRKGSLDFSDFGKTKLTPIGIYDDVEVDLIDIAEIDWNNVNVRFTEKYAAAEIDSTVEACVPGEKVLLEVTVFDPDGELVSEVSEEFDAVPGTAQYTVTATVQDPKLWWPKNYGEQPIYTVRTQLWCDGELADCEEKTVGLRRLEMVGDLKFRVNGKLIKLWGGNIAPFYGLTHRWDPERAETELNLIAGMNMNCLRIWGGGVPCGESLYDLCDKLGIMIWQDFYLTWAYHPDTDKYREFCHREAEQMVKRLRHRACILLWCGGNESFMHNEEGFYDKDWKEIGYKLFRYDFAEPCKRLDPDRHYVLSSPTGGEYPSDTAEGDCHPLNYSLRHSVWKYAPFISEGARTSTGPLRSLERFMTPEEIWPSDYVDHITYHNAYNPFEESYKKAERKTYVTEWKRIPIPKAFWEHSADFLAAEAGPIEKFYDAHDAQSLVYRINAAFAYYTKKYTEMARRGKPFYDVTSDRRVNGHLIWKINDGWPQVYCSLIDYFLEVYIPYYQVKRAFSPVLLSFEFDDHILLWGVNDTAEDVRGTLTVKLFSQARNKVVNELSIPVFIGAGQSCVLTNLDRFSPILRESVLYASLTDESGKVITDSSTLMDLERHLIFPEAKLSLRQEGDDLVVTTDKFAHCVELCGDEDGDQFGWYFEDNYFDLFPFEEKRIKVFGAHERGIVTAKAQYSPHISSTDYTR